MSIFLYLEVLTISNLPIDYIVLARVMFIEKPQIKVVVEYGEQRSARLVRDAQ